MNNKEITLPRIWLESLLKYSEKAEKVLEKDGVNLKDKWVLVQLVWFSWSIKTFLELK